jgi:hypothetical protein
MILLALQMTPHLLTILLFQVILLTPVLPLHLYNPVPAVPTIKRGHILKLIPSGGVFCCRCGKQTKYQKHQRLKILNKPCRFPDLDPSQCLTAPGFNNSTPRIEEAEKTLNQKFNTGNHVLIWHRKLGKIKNKPDYGLIWCSACGRTWPWLDRSVNLSKTMCTQANETPEPPPWVTVLEHYEPPTRNASSSSMPQVRVRRRLYGKQTYRESENELPDTSNAAGVDGGSSSTDPRRGIG